MVKTKTVKLTNLLVNTENYRFEPLTGQKEAIDKMVENQGDKLFNLAKDIILYGLNPNEKIQITTSYHDNIKFTVLEGNRRTVVLKLLNNPDLIDDLKHRLLKNKFKKLHYSNKSNIIEEIECNYYDNPEEAEHWIGIKHGYGESGIGTETWNVTQKGNFKEKTEGEANILTQAIRLLKESIHTTNKTKKKINDIVSTNLQRLIFDPYVREFLGLEYKDKTLTLKSDEKEVIKRLEKVATDCMNPDFKVKHIYTKTDRADYIDALRIEEKKDENESSDSEQESPTATEEESGTTSATETTTEATSTTTSTTTSQRQRTKLISKKCKLNINNPRVNKIYHELQGIDIRKYTNAVAVLFRVFIELSLDTFLEEKKMIKGPSATKERLRLDVKFNKVNEYLKNKKIVDDAISKRLRIEINNKNSLLGIDTWHAYVHNNRFSPNIKDLLSTWDGIETFIEELWNNIK